MYNLRVCPRAFVTGGVHMKTIKCFDTLDKCYKTIEVSDEVAEYIRRSYWREDMQERRYRKRCRSLYDFDITTGNEVESVVLEHELLSMVCDAFERLSSLQKKVIYLYCEKGVTLAGISDILGISISYASKILQTGRKSMLQYLQDEDRD